MFGYIDLSIDETIDCSIEHQYMVMSQTMIKIKNIKAMLKIVYKNNDEKNDEKTEIMYCIKFYQ